MSQMIEFFTLTFTRAEVAKVVEEIKQLLGERSLILFVGEVGAGKTTLISELCKVLDFNEVASPSFAIHHCYKNRHGETLDHVDLYRLKNEEDLESTGFWDLFQQEKAWVMVEWADRLEEHVWPMDWPLFKVELEKLDGEKRRIRISKFEN